MMADLILDRDDANHSKSKAVWAGWLREGAVLVTINYVLLETTALIQHRLGATLTFESSVLRLSPSRYHQPRTQLPVARFRRKDGA